MQVEGQMDSGIVHFIGPKMAFREGAAGTRFKILLECQAVFSATNAKYATISHGANFAVCGDRPSW